MNDKFESLATELDIPHDYEKVPSVIRERLEALETIDGQEFEVARDNLLDIIKMGGDAMTDLYSLSNQTQSARYYESLTELMRVLIEANHKILELKKMDGQIRGRASHDITPSGPTNIIAVGSTAEMLEMLAKARKNK